jgi:hypothetical protein
MTVLNQLAHAQGRRDKAPLKDYPSFVTSGRGSLRQLSMNNVSFEKSKTG